MKKKQQLASKHSVWLLLLHNIMSERITDTLSTMSENIGIWEFMRILLAMIIIYWKSDTVTALMQGNVSFGPNESTFAGMQFLGFHEHWVMWHIPLHPPDEYTCTHIQRFDKLLWLLFLWPCLGPPCLIWFEST